MTFDFKAIQKKSFKNAVAIEQSALCGCYYCLRVYPSSDIPEDNFIEENDGVKTAWCPHCGIDAVIPEDSSYELNEFLLQRLYDKFFEIPDTFE